MTLIRYVKVKNAASPSHRKMMEKLATFVGANGIEYEDLGNGENYTFLKDGERLTLVVRGNRVDGGFLGIE